MQDAYGAEYANDFKNVNACPRCVAFLKKDYSYTTLKKIQIIMHLFTANKFIILPCPKGLFFYGNLLQMVKMWLSQLPQKTLS